jgi:dienelactone hydrolase
MLVQRTPPHPSQPASEAAALRRDRERERAALRRTVRRQRVVAVSLLALATAAVALSVALATGGPSSRRPAGAGEAARHHTAVKSSPKPPPSSFAVGLHVLRLVDGSRSIQLPDGTSEPRTLVTYVRYPALGASSRTDLANAPAAHAYGPFPLVVFGHGFGVTPGLYARLLQSWARAGYVVAAPAFPLENAEAPGGPNESDLINQPADMRFVISGVLAAAKASSGPLAGLIDPTRIAATGQSDGGDTALAVAYDRYFHDPRVGAAVILSGAEIPGQGGFDFPVGSPPLLATQGTADTINPPSFTETFFTAARRPKYLLNLIGAEHLPPYSDQQPQLAIVERVTIAFLDGYLKHRPQALKRLVAIGNVPGTATLEARP